MIRLEKDEHELLTGLSNPRAPLQSTPVPHNSIHPRLSSWNDEFRLVFIILFSASSFKQQYKCSPCAVWEELTCR